MIKLVAFDWNGTIIADTTYCLEAANLVFKRLNHKPISLREYQETTTIPVVNFYLNHGFTAKEFWDNAEENNKIFHTHFESRSMKARTRIGARTTLLWLKKHKIRTAIFSNHPIGGIEAQLRRLDLGDLFEKVIANPDSKTVLSEKNKEQKVKRYMEEFRIKSKEVMIVGDSPEEVEIGKNLGLITVAIKEGLYSVKRLLKTKPDYLVGSLNELTEIIDALNKQII